MFVGAAASLLIVFMSRRFNIRSAHPRPSGRPGMRWLYFITSYLPWLLREIILANIHVAQLVISRKPDLDPHIIEIPINLQRAPAQVLLANSITLTPGTVSIDVRPNRIIAHALTPAASGSLESQDMQQRVAALFHEQHPAADLIIHDRIKPEWMRETR